MATKSEELGQKIYQDELVELRTGIDVKTDVDLRGSSIDYHRSLDNCIKVKAFSPNAHFIQFVTKQYPDLFTFQEEGKLKWDGSIGAEYMSDGVNPKWKLDVTDKASSVFYDEDGLSFKTAGFVAMYDYPGGMFEPPEERGVFCTFIIMEGRITHLAQWSKQFVGAGEGQEAYFVAIPLQRLNATTLPCWAMRAMQRHFSIADENIFPPGLKAILPTQETFQGMPQQAIEAEARGCFLLPPEEWIVKQRYPALFQPLATAVEKPVEEEKKSSAILQHETGLEGSFSQLSAAFSLSGDDLATPSRTFCPFERDAEEKATRLAARAQQMESTTKIATEVTSKAIDKITQAEELMETLRGAGINISLINIVSYDGDQSYFVKVNSYNTADLELARQTISKYEDKLKSRPF